MAKKQNGKEGAQAPVETEKIDDKIVPIAPTKGFWGDAWDAAKAFWAGLGQKTQGIVIGIAAIAVIIILIALFHPFGWMEAAGPAPSVPVVAGNNNNSEIVNALTGMNKSIVSVGQKADQAVAVSKEALNISRQANATASAKIVAPAPAPAPAGKPAGVVSANTMDDVALGKANSYLANAKRLVNDADRAKEDARDAVRNGESSDADEAKDDANEIIDDASDLRQNIRDLQQDLDTEWANEARNETARNKASGILDDALDEISDAKKTANEAVDKANELVEEPENQGSQQGQQSQQSQQSQGGQVSLPKLQSATT
jgi:hypothetical protein